MFKVNSNEVNNSNTNNSNVIDETIKIIKNEYQDYSFNVTTLFKRSSFYPDKIRDILYIEMEITPFTLIENIRIEKSLYFLYKGTPTVKETFKIAGYSSARVFRNAFKKRIGFSPSELRSRVENDEEFEVVVESLWENR